MQKKKWAAIFSFCVMDTNGNCFNMTTRREKNVSLTFKNHMGFDSLVNRTNSLTATIEYITVTNKLNDAKSSQALVLSLQPNLKV